MFVGYGDRQSPLAVPRVGELLCVSLHEDYRHDARIQGETTCGTAIPGSRTRKGLGNGAEWSSEVSGGI